MCVSGPDRLKAVYAFIFTLIYAIKIVNDLKRLHNS